MNDASKQVSVEALAEEYIERKRHGESPAMSEYTAKYPQLADEIEDIFPAMELMEDFKPASGDLSDESSASRPAVPTLRQVAGYRILKEIGRGGMGVVYEAEQQSLGRRVALKVLPSSIAGGTKMLDRFQREARAAAKMHHTNIVPVFEVGHDDQCAFYAMQLIQGQGLDAVIGDLRDLRSAHSGPNNDPDQKQVGGRQSLAHSLVTGHFDCAKLDDSESKEVGNSNLALAETVESTGGSTVSAVLPGEGDLSTAEDNRRAYFRSVAEIGHQCAEALSYAHARGIIHRDIKPSNLLLDTNGVVWVTDFGLAKTNDVGLTQTGDILGTIRYMSPERFKGQCDDRADVYSLGLTLYELLVLKPAYESPDRLKLIDIVCKTDVNALRSIDSRVPRDLETIVLKACDKDPKRRYQSADEMAEDLQRFINDEPIQARRASATERVARWTRRNPWLATAMSVAAVALIAITGISLIAAQTQSDLNDELTLAYSEVEKKADEEKKANAALVESNRSKEELITELKRSQSRLAEKQAEFVADKDDLPESLMWLGRSLEFTDEDDQKTRSRLLAKISHSASRMPRLISEIPVNSRIDDLQLTQAADRIRNPDSPQNSLFKLAAKLSPQLRQALGGVNSARHSENLLAFKLSADSDGDHRDTIRCYDTRTRQWTGSVLACDGFLVSHGINESKRWLATVAFQVIPTSKANQDSDDDADDSGSVDITLRETVLVRNIDSGKVIYESHSDLDRSREISIIPQYAIANNTRVHLTEDGRTLIKLTPTGRNALIRNEYRVDQVALPSGSVSSSSVSTTQQTPGMIRGGTPGAYGNGKRLFVVALPSSPLLRSSRTNQLLCFDVGTGQQVGQTILFNDGMPLILSPAGDRVAVLRAEGSQRWVQIHDVESGDKIGESLDLNVPMSTEIRISHGASNSNRLVLTFQPMQSSQADGEDTVTRSWVQVFDLGLRHAVTPRLPTDGPAIDAVLTEDDHVVVRDRSRIRVWQVPGRNVVRTLLTSGSNTPRGYLMRAIDQSQLRTIDPYKSERRLTTWSADTGRVMTSVQMKSAGQMAFAMDPSAEFLLMGETPRIRTSMSGNALRPRLGEKLLVEVCETQSGSVIGGKTELPDRHSPAALGPGGKEVAMVFQPERGRLMSEFQVRVLDRETTKLRDVPEPRDSFLPDFVDFSLSGERLFVISAPGPTLDIYDLTQPEIQHIKSVALNQFAEVVGTPSIGALFANGPWSVSTDGQLVAGFSEEGHLLVQDITSGAIVHRVQLATEGRSVFLDRPPISFSAEDDSVCIGRAGGLILRSRLSEQWAASRNEIFDRLRTVTGLEFAHDDVIQLARLARQTAWTADSSPNAESLDAREMQAIEHFRDERWRLASEEFSAWQKRRPNDWIPMALRILPLIRLGQFSEADRTWEKFEGIVGTPTATAWLNYLDDVREETKRFAAGYSSVSPPTEDRELRWFQTQRLDLASSDEDRARILMEMAQSEEMCLDLEKAANTIDEALKLGANVADIHHYRAHLMERLNRWPAALESRQAVLRLEPKRSLTHFRVAAGHLYAGDDEAFHNAWAEQLESSEKILAGEATNDMSDRFGLRGIRDTVAKLRLIAGGPLDHGMKRALQLADENFNSPEAMKSAGKDWHLLCKGIAEYRRGEPEDLKAAIKHFGRAFSGFSEAGGTYLRGQAITQFFAAMVHHELSNMDAARDAYLDGLDRLHRDEFNLRVSDSATWHEWQLAQVARREAAGLLKIDIDSIDPVPQDTSKWTVLLEDSFDGGISDRWIQRNGDWNVVDGAACGTLEYYQRHNINCVYLDREIPGAPSTFEVEYETWVSDPMLAACLLRLPDANQPTSYRVALASHPDFDLTRQGKVGIGVSLLTHSFGGLWIDKSASNFTVKPGQHYKVRIIRQPQRITVFLDDGTEERRILSERVRNIDSKSIRFFARGEVGTKMFIDNVRIRVP